MKKRIEWRPHSRKLLRFLLAGLPSFLVALPVNMLLVEKGGVPIPISYMVVLCMQVVVNFFLCRWFVFEPHPGKSLLRQFWQFFTGILFFRAADWALYTLLTSVFDLYYVAVQLMNILLFAALKFHYSRSIMEQRHARSNQEVL